MILYLGTSSLVKLYVREPFSDLVRAWVKEAEIVATCRVAYTEIIAALDLRFTSKDLTKDGYDLLVKDISRDWANYAVVDFDELEAGRLVKKYGLRRFDAIHLSAAKLIQEAYDDILLSFSSVNEKLCAAAAAEGIRVLQLK